MALLINSNDMTTFNRVIANKRDQLRKENSKHKSAGKLIKYQMNCNYLAGMAFVLYKMPRIEKK